MQTDLPETQYHKQLKYHTKDTLGVVFLLRSAGGRLPPLHILTIHIVGDGFPVPFTAPRPSAVIPSVVEGSVP